MRASLILLSALLTSCGKPSTPPAGRLAPVPPPLPAEFAAPCPPLTELAGKSIGELTQADFDAVLIYAICQRRHAAVVNAYVGARQAAVDWNAGQ